MLITIAQLEKFSGVYKDSTDATEVALENIYINTATEIINEYVGYDVEATYEEKEEEVPALFKFVCLEIASLVQMEESSNLGVNSSADTGGVSRSFLNVVDYSKYLARLSSYRTNTTL